MGRNSRRIIPVAAVIAACVAAVSVKEAAAQAAQQAQQAQLPEGVTAKMVEEGKQIFHGPGLCLTCHGENGQGTPIAPTLADDKWLHIDGSYDAIVKLITTGVPQPKEAMVPMLPKAGSEITADQIKAVAAYVWTLSRPATGSRSSGSRAPLGHPPR
jgi:mono/diheme cytochrome c family protein